MSEGYIKLYRRLKEWGWYDNPNMVATWVHILLSANWKDGQEWHGTPLGRGELITSLPKLAKNIGLSEKQIRVCIDRLEKSGEIRKCRADKGTRIIICKYDDYQGFDEDEGQTNGRMRADEGQEKGRQRAALEEEKKEKEKDIKKKKEDAAERIYRLYPTSAKRAEGNRVSLKSSKDKERIFRLLDTYTEEQLTYTINRYLAEQPGAYIKAFSTFLNNLPDYGNPDSGELFEDKPWKKKGVLYVLKDFTEHMSNTEYFEQPTEIKAALMTKRSVMWDGTRFIVPQEGQSNA